MTKKEIDRISRSLVGHLGTSPQVRARMGAAKTDEERVDIINETVVPKDNIKVEHLPAVQSRVRELFKEEEQPDPGEGKGIFQFGG